MPPSNWVDSLSEEWVSQPSNSSPIAASGTKSSLSDFLARSTAASPSPRRRRRGRRRDTTGSTSTVDSKLSSGTQATGSTSPLGTTAIRKGAGGERNEEWKRHVLEQHNKDLFSPLMLESLFQPPPPAESETMDEPVKQSSSGPASTTSSSSEQDQPSQTKQQQSAKARKTMLPVPLPTLQEEKSDGGTPKRLSPRRHLPSLLRTSSEPSELPSDKKPRPLPAITRPGSEPSQMQHESPKSAKAPLRSGSQLLRKPAGSPVENAGAEKKRIRKPFLYSKLDQDATGKNHLPHTETGLVKRPKAKPSMLWPSGRWSTINSENTRRHELISPVSESMWNDGDSEKHRGRTPDRRSTASQSPLGLSDESPDEGHDEVGQLPEPLNIRKFTHESAICQSSPPMTHQYRSTDQPDFDDTYLDEPSKSLLRPANSPARLPTPDKSPDLRELPSIAPGNNMFFQNVVQRRVGGRSLIPHNLHLETKLPSSGHSSPFSTPNHQRGFSDVPSQTPPSAERSSRSPMKLFACDTYTSSKLQQRLEQMERSMAPPHSGSHSGHHDHHASEEDYDEDISGDDYSHSSSERSYSGGSSVVNHLEKVVRPTERSDSPPRRGQKRAQKDLTLTDDFTGLADPRRSSAPSSGTPRSKESGAKKHRRWHSDESFPGNDGASNMRSPFRDRQPKRMRRSINRPEEPHHCSLARRHSRAPRRRRGLTIEEGSILSNSSRHSRVNSRELPPPPSHSDDDDECPLALAKRQHSSSPADAKKRRPHASPRKSDPLLHEPLSPLSQYFGSAGFMTFNGKGGCMQGLPDFDIYPHQYDDELRRTSFTTESWLAQAEDVMESIRKRNACDGNFFDMDAAGHSFTKGMEILRKKTNLLTITNTVGNRPRGSSFLERRVLPSRRDEDDGGGGGDALTAGDEKDRGLGSSVQSRTTTVETIANEPEILNHHLAMKNHGGMVFDQNARAWVSREPEKEDPFHGISDLSVDSKEEERVLDMARRQWSSHPTSESEERSSAWRTSKFVEDQERQMTSSRGSSRSVATDAMSEFAAGNTETRVTSYGTDRSDPRDKEQEKQDLQNAAAALEEPDHHEDHGEENALEHLSRDLPKLPPHVGFKGAVYSSPVKLEDEVDGFLEHGSLRQHNHDSNNSINYSSLRSNQNRRRSSRPPLMSRTPITGIAEVDETHEPAPPRYHPDIQRELNALNFSSNLTPLPTPFRSHISLLPPPSTNRKGQVSFHLNSLTNISYQFETTELVHLERSYIASRRGPRATDKLINQTFTLTEKAINNLLEDIEKFNPNWPYLKTLDISKRKLETLHSLDDQCPQLHTLDASDNELGQLLGVPISVFELKLCRNNLTDATYFGHLMNLEFLDVSGNGLDRLDALKNCRHLREIRADDNKIKGIEGLWGMDGLVKLRARRNQIESVDFKGSGLKRLTDLDLRGNHLNTLTNLHHLPTLLNLNLDDNHLITLTSSPVPSLRSLKLQNNLLSTLSLSPFPSLRILYLDSNPLHSLTHTSRCVSLDSVSLRTCSPWTPSQLLSLLRALTDVRKIYLSGNDIRTLPERGMPRFLNCQLLEMANTGLEEIPRGWEKTFPNLRRCNLNWSGVGEEGIARVLRCRRLVMLEAVGTRVGRVPAAQGGGGGGEVWGRELKYLDLRGTPLTNGFYPPEASKPLNPDPSPPVPSSPSSLSSLSSSHPTSPGRELSPAASPKTSNAKATPKNDTYTKDPYSLREWMEEEGWKNKLPREVRERRRAYEEAVGRGRVGVLDGRREWRG